MEEGEKDFGVINTLKNIHKKVVNNDLVSEFDVFSVPVKLTLKGNEVYQTVCGGCVHFLLLIACIGLTILILFPSGIQLNSQLAVADLPTNGEDTGQKLFDHTDQIMSWRGLRKSGNTITGYSNVSAFSRFKVYQRDTNNITT